MQTQLQTINNPQPLFDIVDQEQLAELTKYEPEAKCQVYIKKDNPLNLTDKKQIYPIQLQIRHEHILEYCPKRQNIISGFRCDYSHQFEIIRKAAFSSGKVGEAIGIRICLKHFSKPLDCLIKSQQKGLLQQFSRVLAQKYIVQLGFHNLFKAIRKIGKGMTACVYNALCYTSGKEVAIKSFRRSVYFASEDNNGEKSFKKEFKFLTKLNHKNICKFNGVFETQNSTYVVMELLPMSLYGYLQKYGFPSEQKAKKIMKGLLEGVKYIHQKGIMHRDLKLENIMVKKDPDIPTEMIPVIVDLGLAEYYDSKQYLYVRCGTPGYVAPEVLKIKSTDVVKTYTSKCDIFSLGVVFYILLFQKALFEGADVAQVVKKNSQCDINFENHHFCLLSQEGRNFFKRMLDKNSQSRISAIQALMHPYFTGQIQAQQISKQEVCGPTNQHIPEEKADINVENSK